MAFVSQATKLYIGKQPTWESQLYVQLSEASVMNSITCGNVTM